MDVDDSAVSVLVSHWPKCFRIFRSFRNRTKANHVLWLVTRDPKIKSRDLSVSSWSKVMQSGYITRSRIAIIHLILVHCPISRVYVLTHSCPVLPPSHQSHLIRQHGPSSNWGLCSKCLRGALPHFPKCDRFFPSLPVKEELDMVRVPNLLIDNLFDLQRSGIMLC